MNIERLIEIAEILETRSYTEQFDVGFNMAYVITPAAEPTHLGPLTNKEEHECGTTCCIAGIAALRYRPEMFHKDYVIYDSVFISPLYGVVDIAEEVLGLDSETAESLFFPLDGIVAGSNINWRDIKPETAAKVIRNLVATGKVDWTTPVLEQIAETAPHL
jgi:hypothetical protein